LNTIYCTNRLINLESGQEQVNLMKTQVQIFTGNKYSRPLHLSWKTLNSLYFLSTFIGSASPPLYEWLLGRRYDLHYPGRRPLYRHPSTSSPFAVYNHLKSAVLPSLCHRSASLHFCLNFRLGFFKTRSTLLSRSRCHTCPSTFFFSSPTSGHH
jgi:hypothetical protein